MLIYKKKKKSLLELLADRYLLLAIGISMMFGIVIYHFYKIQIIEHDVQVTNLRETIQREVEIPALRGCIYDRYGKPLAVNQSINVLKYNPEVRLKTGELDQILLRVIKVLEDNHEKYLDNMPISTSIPFTYTEEQSSVKRFIVNYVPCDMSKIDTFYKMSAPELIAYLRGEDVFNIDKSINDEEARKIIAMRLEIRQTTYQKYKKITLAESISMKTVTVIEENQEDFPGISVDQEAQRYYTYGKAFGNILGYTRKITESQYETMKDQGYDRNDIVGQVGIESEEESELQGEKGNQLIEVDDVGRTVFTLEKNEAVNGNDIYLSIDANLQVDVYNALEKRLAQGIVKRLRGESKTLPLTAREILVSMAEDNQIDFNEMSQSLSSDTQKQLYMKLSKSYEEASKQLEEKQKGLDEDKKTKLTLKQHFIELLKSESSTISDKEFLIALIEQGSLTVSDEMQARIKAGNYDLTELMIQLLESGGVRPDQMSVSPCSGAAVIVNPNNGETLALVSYPSYDNNEFIQDFNGIYTKINDGIDSRNLEVNRALKTAKAPGSTFKMITGTAGLEEGVVTSDTLIYDSGAFTKAGDPPLKCWIFTNTGSGHGDENMEGALEVSCNYYFSEVEYRLGEKFGAPYGGIKVLTKYAEMFGLGEKTGIELEEISPNISNPTNSVTTQAARAINGIRYLKDNEEAKKKLYQEVSEYLDKGFFVISTIDHDEIGKEEQSQIDRLIKGKVDEALGIALSEDLESIYDKLLEDYNEIYEQGVSRRADKVAQKVMAGDTSLSLKYRTKTILKEMLIEDAQAGTKKKIRKALKAIPEGVLEGAYIEAYEEVLNDCKQNNKSKEVIDKLDSQLLQLQQGKFDYMDIMTSRVLERIVGVYLEDYFEKVEMEWTTRDNISSAIGQGEHAFTPVQMARYIAGIANGKKVYNLTILNGIQDHKETGTFLQKKPTVFNVLHLRETTSQIIREGMRKVAAGEHGTARNYYADSPVKLAAKTGTAQEGGHENSWVVSFAPYDQPEVAVAISMYGTDGIGSCTYELLNDIYSFVFKLNQVEEKRVLSNQFIR